MSETNAVEGTCKLCGQVLVLTDDDCWHPAVSTTVPCPPEPENPKDLGAWVEWYGSGKRPGRPGRENFISERRTDAPA